MVEIGSKYGMLTVVSAAEADAQGARQWYCVCDCGQPRLKPVRGYVLARGDTKSCGCLIGAHKRTHGMTRTQPYISYMGAKARCEYEGDKSWDRYGGRGIEFRLPSFEEFWVAMKSTWFEGAQLDRDENDGHYELGNVKWSTPIENANNRSNSRLLTHDGITLTLTEWAAKIGVTKSALWRRLKTKSVAEAITI